MVFKWFNSDFLRESVIVKDRLIEIIDREIVSVQTAISLAASDKEGEKLELQKLKQSLLIKKAMAEFEAEEIVKKRVDLRIAFSALIFSAFAVVVSMLTLYIKV